MSDKLFRLDCGYQNYDWGKIGTSSSVAQFASKSNENTKIDESKPYAELWMGTHPNVPSIVVDGSKNDGKTLREVVEANPDLVGQDLINKFGGNVQLPFLFKVLSIGKALSIQAHPDIELARKLHARDPGHYPDDNHKPEMTIALTKFEGFCGFKPLDQISQTLKTVTQFRDMLSQETIENFPKKIVVNAEPNSPQEQNNKHLLQQLFSEVMNNSKESIYEKTGGIVEDAISKPEIFAAIDPRLPELIVRLNKQYPHDIGLVSGCLLLNHVELVPGEAMYLGAKDPHAYISGDVIECMAASDNVVRAGFTPKFTDVDTLVDMLTYECKPIEKQKMIATNYSKCHGDAKKSLLYDPPIEEFSVLQTIFDSKGGKQSFDKINGPSIIIATQGSGKITLPNSTPQIFKTGYVYFIAPNTEFELIADSGEEFTTYKAFVESS